MTPLEHLSRQASQVQEEILEDLDHIEEVRHKLFSPKRQPHKIPFVKFALAFAGAAVAVFVTLFCMFSLDPEPLTFTAGDQPGRVGQWLVSNSANNLQLRFSDGTHVDLLDEAAARVDNIHQAGARVTVERGQVDANVRHLEHTRWEFAVGPFEILVIGTRFNVRWNAEREEMSLAVTEGAIVLNGPEISDRVVSEGQILCLRLEREDNENAPELVESSGACPRINPPETPEIPTPNHPSAELVVKRDTPNPAHRNRLKTPPSPRRQIIRPPTSDNEEAEPAAPSAPAWQELARRGRYTEAMALIEAGDWSEAVERSTASDLLLLADTTRLTGRRTQAVSAYQRLRERFPGTEPSATAAFQLGRLHFDHQRSITSASRWFRVYLRERPSGRFSREALGRLIEVMRESGDSQGAQNLARRYLERYPEGPHSRLARSVLAE